MWNEFVKRRRSPKSNPRGYVIFIWKIAIYQDRVSLRTFFYNNLI